MLAIAGSASGQPARQSLPENSAATPLSRKIALMVRSQFSVPSDCDITIGSRAPSATPGFDTLRVAIRRGDESTAIDFLISSDNRTLARMEKFDLDANPALAIDLRGRPIRGNPDAPVTIVSFDDLECPVCARMHQVLIHDTLPRYANQIRVVYKDNPLREIHPWALHAAVDAHCLADQATDAFWNYVDYVHTHGQEVTGEARDLPRSYSVLDRIAGAEGAKANLNAATLMACLKTQDETPVLQSMKEASRLGLSFAPAVFVNGEEIRGLASDGELARVIDRALRDAGAAPAGPRQTHAAASPQK